MLKQVKLQQFFLLFSFMRSLRVSNFKRQFNCPPPSRIGRRGEGRVKCRLSSVEWHDEMRIGVKSTTGGLGEERGQVVAVWEWGKSLQTP